MRYLQKTIVPKAENLSLGYRSKESFDSFEFCSKCSEPIVKILKNKKLLKIKD